MLRSFARRFPASPPDFSGAWCGTAGMEPQSTESPVLQRTTTREHFTERITLGDLAALCGVGSFLILMSNMIHTNPPKG